MPTRCRPAPLHHARLMNIFAAAQHASQDAMLPSTPRFIIADARLDTNIIYDIIIGRRTFIDAGYRCCYML